jgi:hypothetical protein
LVFQLWIAPFAIAGDPLEVLPDHERNDLITTPAEYFGFAIGSRHLRHHQILGYFETLGAESDRVRVETYATSHGGRELLVAVITSPENFDNLDAILDQRQELVSGRWNQDVDSTPAVMYMGYTVHGDEASGVNAAPLVAYQLASSTDASVTELLERNVILIDPMLNPDGIDRFANWANENRGQFASESNADREHNQPWPGGRTNYYWFDLNRDWLPLVHPESQGRLRLFHRWRPNVLLDFHEMGGQSTYFFQPGVPARTNPLTPAANQELTALFADEHARRMDAAGELYFTKEQFDDFYMGKGSTYPDLHGAVGILFEQGSTRGLTLANESTERSFADTVANHVRLSFSSLDSLAAHRERLLEFQTEFYNASLKKANSADLQGYLLAGERSRIDAAASLLQSHSIEAYELPYGGVAGDNTFSLQNVLVIPMAQPESTFIRSLFSTETSFEENIFYDVSTWHLPSAFDLQVVPLDTPIPDVWLETKWTASIAKTDRVVLSDPQSLGFAIDPVSLDAPKFVLSLMAADVRVRMTSKEIKTSVSPQLDLRTGGNGDGDGNNDEVVDDLADVNDEEFNSNSATIPRGSYLILKSDNRDGWAEIESAVREANDLELQLTPLLRGLSVSGPDLGSNSLTILEKCIPALIVGEGTSSYAAGSIWHFLDQRLQTPHTLLDADRLPGSDLNAYSCLILPNGSFGNWSQTEADALEDYVRQGGTVIAVGGSIRWLQSNGLCEVETNQIETEEDQPAAEYADASELAALQNVAGLFLETDVDVSHPLGYGFPDQTVPVFRTYPTSYAQPKVAYRLAAVYRDQIAGYLSESNKANLMASSSVWAEPMGRGNIICLADESVFRGYIRSSERFLTNAMLLGPTLEIPRAVRGENADDGHGH